MTRHQFLSALHEMLKPQLYLEVGVQYGGSLALAKAPTEAIGIDPAASVMTALSASTTVVHSTSDDYFDSKPQLPGPIDLAFIDGMHLFEYALRDFANIEQRSHCGGVVVFDDVLPRNQAEGSRFQVPGDWAGDTWKVYPILLNYRPDLFLALVDVEPTGVLVVADLHPTSGPPDIWGHLPEIVPAWIRDQEVPGEVLSRKDSVDPVEALTLLGEVLA